MISMLVSNCFSSMNRAIVKKDSDQIHNKSDVYCRKSSIIHSYHTAGYVDPSNLIFVCKTRDRPCLFHVIRYSSSLCSLTIYLRKPPLHLQAPISKFFAIFASSTMTISWPSISIIGLASFFRPPNAQPFPIALIRSTFLFLCTPVLLISDSYCPVAAPESKSNISYRPVPSFVATVGESPLPVLLQASSEVLLMDRSEDCLHCRDLQAELEQVRTHQCLLDEKIDDATRIITDKYEVELNLFLHRISSMQEQFNALSNTCAHI